MFELFEAAAKFGLNTVLPIMAAVFMCWMLKYVLEQNQTREAKYQEIIKQQNEFLSKSFVQHDERAASAIKRLEDANNYQRSEHQAMMEQHAGMMNILSTIAERVSDIKANLNLKVNH